MQFPTEYSRTRPNLTLASAVNRQFLALDKQPWQEEEYHSSGELPAALALASGASFVARGFSGDPNGLARLLVEAIEHPGFAFVHVLSPCPTFRPEQMDWKHAVRALEAEETSDPVVAAQRVQADDGMSTGLIYRDRRPAWRPPQVTEPSRLAQIEEAFAP